ncbi:MAG: NADP-dependent oxidoreductase [Cyclobacteriaceae bacterium]|nr:NADP-dependent oxidoreductase [Cyclobacteriaceae bacterium]
MNTRQIVLAERPKGAPTTDTFRFETTTLPPLQPGEVLLQGKYYSVDPYMRGRMNDRRSYIAPFRMDQPMEGAVVAEVLQSKSDRLSTGDLVTGMLPWREKMVVKAVGLLKTDTSLAPASYYLGLLGIPGLTAYFGMMDIGKPKAGETVVISGAAGAVGLVAGQIGKIHGCRVIGIAGSDKKTDILVDEFGFDGAINYKTTKDMRKAVAELCPDGVDIYFDNVGGDISDAVISNINFHGRIPLCGQIALYNAQGIPTGPRMYPVLLTRSVLLQGFIIRNFPDRFPEGIKQLSAWLKEGKMKFTETIVEGFDQIPQALLGLFTGENTGKMVVKA